MDRVQETQNTYDAAVKALRDWREANRDQAPPKELINAIVEAHIQHMDAKEDARMAAVGDVRLPGLEMGGVPRLLDLFSGAGGAAKGYQRAGFYVVGVDNRLQPRYCGDEFHQADAFEYLAEHGHEFDVIHASPPFQAYTGMRRITLARFGSVPEYPDLIADVRQALQASGKIYVIENVQNSPLHTQLILCGAALGLPHLARHRHFESNVLFVNPPACAHYANEYTIGVYGERPNGRRVSYRQHRLGRIASSINEAREVMGIDWMEWGEIKEAIPPAYTHYIGKQLMSILTNAY